MKNYIFGYGSLINLESASRTLKRTLERQDVFTVHLKGYLRCWNLFDDVFSNAKSKDVKAVFLNIVKSESSVINGIILPVNEHELDYFKTREKNYDCVDVSQQIVNSDDKKIIGKIKVYTFVGKPSCLTENSPDFDYFIFQKYINIVEKGVKSFDANFWNLYNETTIPFEFPILEGDYQFIDSNQQKAR
jgi:hypothetical protein